MRVGNWCLKIAIYNLKKYQYFSCLRKKLDTFLVCTTQWQIKQVWCVCAIGYHLHLQVVEKLTTEKLKYKQIELQNSTWIKKKRTRKKN